MKYIFPFCFLFISFVSLEAYSSDISSLKEAAKQGDPGAQFNLGMAFFEGGNYTKATKWIEKAAAQDHPGALYLLARILLEDPRDVKRFVQAFKLLKKAAEQGNAKAQQQLDELKEEVIKVQSNLQKRIEVYSSASFGERILLLKEAAKQGNANAQFNLGMALFDFGNYKAAAEWIEKAAAQDHLAAQYRLGRMYFIGLGAPKDIYKAIELLTRAAYRGNADAQFYLGAEYFIGKKVPKDIDKAFEFLKFAAEQGNANAQFGLGTALFDFEKYTKAIYWLERAAAQDHPLAQSWLGRMYLEGLGVPKDILEAQKWFKKSAEQGDTNAQYQLAKTLFKGENYLEAAEWFKKAAMQNHYGAQLNLVRMYSMGLGVPRNMTKARQWFTVAFTRNDSKVQKKLKKLQEEENQCPKNFKK